MQFEPHHWQAMRDWLSSPLGKRFVAMGALQLEQQVASLYGHHLLLIGEPSCRALFGSSAISHRIWVHPQPASVQRVSYLRSRQDKLPLQNESIDLACLAYCLEFAPNPHEVLREAYRVLRPQGHLIVYGFNPYSLWGLWRQVARFWQPAPWAGQFVSMGKLKDWLALLGFDILTVRYYGFGLPQLATAEPPGLEAIGRKLGLPWGAGFSLLANKRVLPLTLIRNPWQFHSQLINPDLAEPSPRG